MDPAKKVLVVLSSDGCVEYYGEEGVSVKVVVKPHAETVDGEILAERYLETKLPWSWRELYVPGNLKARDVARRVEPMDLLHAKMDLELIGTLEQVGGKA